MYCRHCGNLVPDGQKFCGHCGKAVNQQDQKKEAILTTCPNCGGGLRLTNDRERLKCPYCGFEDILSEVIHSKEDTRTKVDRFFNLANVAWEGKNFENAYSYYTQILELDQENKSAWVGKGCSALYLSTIDSPRFAEFFACCNTAFIPEKSDPDWKEWAAKRREIAVYNLTTVTIWYAEKVIEHLWRTMRGYASMPSYDSGLSAGAVASIQNFRLLMDLRNSFTDQYEPNLINSIKYAWWLCKSEKIAESIYYVINTVKKSQVLSKKMKQSFVSSIDDIIIDIRNRFPNWTPPQPKKK